MKNLIERLYATTGRLLEKSFGSRAVLIDPDGQIYKKSAVDENGDPYDESTPEEERRDLQCSVFREHTNVDVRTGFDNLVDRPVAVFWIKSLTRVPKSGEKWMIQVTRSPLDDTLESWVISEPPKTGRTIGFVNIRLRRARQV